jgi:hypothetical protein
MKTASVTLSWLLILVACSFNLHSQSAASSPMVPRLVNFSGRAVDVQGRPIAGITGITFAIYKDQYEGSPLWSETQNVQADARGGYAVQLGAATAHGLPLELFSSGEARWLGVRINGSEEQPRVLLLSVPYALKAADAQTLGGLPPSAFVLAGTPNSTSVSSTASPSSPNISTSPVGGSGTQNYIPLWTDNNGDLGNSILYQTGSGSTAKIGINEKSPLFTLDVNGQELVRGLFEMATTNYATKTKGFNSNPLNLESSAFNSTTGKYTLNHFQWQAEPVGNNTTSPGATLNLLYGTDPASPTETGLALSSTGLFTFASGQMFPGTGTITGVTTATGSGLTGGGNSGTLALSLTNSCSANQVLQWNGTTWVCSTIGGTGTITGVTAGTGMTGGGTSGNVTLNVDSTKVAFLNVANKFTKAISVTTPFGSVPITAQSPYEAINATMTGDYPGVAAIEGMATSTGGNDSTYGVYGSSSSDSGIGVFGTTNGATGSGVYGQAALLGSTGVTGANGGEGGTGVYGFSTGSGNTVIGVHGKAPAGIGVLGESTSNIGIIGQSTNFYGVSGQSTSSYGVSGQSTSAYGVAGFTSTNGGGGVYGYSPNTVGVFGSSSGGFGFATDSPVQQARSAGGWVKAMIYVNGRTAPYTIVRCFNSTLIGPAATTPPCGFDLKEAAVGNFVNDFGFEIDDRFILGQLGEFDNLSVPSLFVRPVTGSPNQVSAICFTGGGGNDTTPCYYYLFVF